ncbi:MAG: type II secretion system protein [Lentisphaerota bacterium]
MKTIGYSHCYGTSWSDNAPARISAWFSSNGGLTWSRKDQLRVATCRPTEQSGFTLLEMLVVLAIAGLLAGVTLPNLSKMADRARLSTQRQSILSGIENLGYWAYSNGKSYTLTALDQASEKPPFSIPDGWRLKAERPITYAVNGVCSGGVIALSGPDQASEQLLLKAPLCRVELLADS